MHVDEHVHVHATEHVDAHADAHANAHADAHGNGPCTTRALCVAGDELQMRLQGALSRGDLPGPLKLVALVVKDWRLASDWERWKVTIP